MKIKSTDYQVPPGKKVNLKRWPTQVAAICQTKKQYQNLLADHGETPPGIARHSKATLSAQLPDLSYLVDVHAMLSKDEKKKNIVLQPGDHIIADWSIFGRR